MTGRNRRRAAVLTVLVGVALGAAAPVALAHPFGPPATLELTADGHRAQLRWQAAPDDLIALGGALGVLPTRREIVIDPGASADVAPVEDDDATRLRTSEAFAGYLASSIRVLQDGTPCPAEVDLARLVDAGATVTVTCPAPIREVDVEVTTLTDLHEAYRTVVVGPADSDPGRSLHTASDPRVSWRLTSGADAATAGSPTVGGIELGLRGRLGPGGALALALLALGAVAVALVGRRRTRSP